MKTYKNLFNKICSFENLLLAYQKARKCKRYRDYVLEFSYGLEKNLLELQKELLTQTYKHGAYREFAVCDSKRRQIRAAPFRDRIIHHALCDVIESIFDKGFIYDSYACRKEKGTHKAVERLQKFLKSISDHREAIKVPKIYCLKCDISKYFESINHQILFGLIQEKIADQKVLWLIKLIIESNNKEIGKGIPIGNLTSQLFANIYLDVLDQFLKHQLQTSYYLRYMDDFLIIDFDKRCLRWIRDKIREFLRKRLGLELHPKKADIFPTDKGIDFLGYQNFRDYRLLRKSTVKRFIKRTKFYQKRLINGLMTQEKFDNSLQSWLAYADWGNSWHLRKKLSEKLKLKLIK